LPLATSRREKLMSDHTEATIRASSDNCDAGPDCRICRDVRPLLRLLDEARAERDALVQALHIYGEHRDYCRSGEFTREVDAAGNAVSRPCACGLEDALERYPLATKE